MDIRSVVTEFRNVTPLEGLTDAWSWSPTPRVTFAGALSADGKRLLQLSGRNSYDRELATATLLFAREHEDEIFVRNPFLGALEGFEPPAGRSFDAVVGIAPEVHEFYRVEKPELTAHVRLAFPAYSCEFSGAETLEEAITRYRMLRLNNLDRGPLPFLKMRYANTRTRGRSTNPGRGLTEPQRLEEELREMEGGAGSIVEFENRHGHVWRVMWDGVWLVAEWDTQDGVPREIGIEELVDFALARLRD
ncbi:hypothetical protein DI272_27285 [Streptomyces sp. Act143]|uniref:hypothetical protein n=1 Tax=Streptomyces sp. Act143 TaxID=2200760 RepID=UPI000D679BE1|nr:hypothetical protein [Streptomyces sp. Act143]PWI17450.1 hypothetical protein DI272_27285 [Streptomyces sp. Act143]